MRRWIYLLMTGVSTGGCGRGGLWYGARHISRRHSMAHRKIFVGLTLAAALGFLAAYVPGMTARAENKPAAAAATCKLHGKKCCDPAIAAHLPKEAVYKACGESDATYLGEDGSEKDTCKYVFKVAGEKEDNTYVQVYACLLYTSDAADDLLCVDLGGRRIINKKNTY